MYELPSYMRMNKSSKIFWHVTRILFIVRFYITKANNDNDYNTKNKDGEMSQSCICTIEITSTFTIHSFHFLWCCHAAILSVCRQILSLISNTQPKLMRLLSLWICFYPHRHSLNISAYSYLSILHSYSLMKHCQHYYFTGLTIWRIL